MVESNEINQEKKGRGPQVEFPVLSLNYALEVVKIIEEKLGGRAGSYGVLSQALDVKGGALILRVTAARRYGLIEPKGDIRPTALAKKILHPIKEEEKVEGIKEAINNVKLFKELGERFSEKIPEREILENILIREYDVPNTSVSRVSNAIIKNMELILYPKEMEEEKPKETKHKEVISEKNKAEYSGTEELKDRIIIITEFGKFETSVSHIIDWDLAENRLRTWRLRWEDENEPVEGESAEDETGDEPK